MIMACCCSGGPLYIGTTPKHVFTFPVPAEELKKVIITYAQDDKIIFEKDKDDLTFDELPEGATHSAGWLRLTQEETKEFDPEKKKYCIQVKALSYFDEVIAGDKRFYSIKSSLHNEVIS